VALFGDVATGVNFWTIVVSIFVLIVTLLLMFIILIQRGKGGGLIGALGGVGGSSPFGSRAGDTFTKITLYLALVWGLLIVIQTVIAKHYDTTIGQSADPRIPERGSPTDSPP
jgi:preprotein translocase subunit SecG